MNDSPTSVIGSCDISDMRSLESLNRCSFKFAKNLIPSMKLMSTVLSWMVSDMPKMANWNRVSMEATSSSGISLFKK